MSSKCLYRCLRALDVFVYIIIIAKKDAFCQDFASISFIRSFDLLVINFEKSKLFCELSDDIIA